MSTSYTEKTHSAFHGAPIDTSDPKTLAWLIRRHGLEMTHISRGSHIGAIFSVAEIMAVLYTRILRVDPKNPQWENRDRLILSKGHAGASVYAALAERGFFPVEELSTHYANGSRLSGHVSHKGVPGVEFSTGSLGHGLSVAAGMALGGKKDNADWRVYCVLGDGECDEGSVWEAALQAHQFKLDNLVAIIDHNRMQSLDFCENTLALEPFGDKWRAFGWNVIETDGNDVDEDYTETTEAIAHGEGGQDVSSPATYYAGPIHVLSDGQDGEQVTKTGKVSGKTVTEVTKQPVDSGYSAYSVNTNGDKVIALTFDDGPWPTTTSEILDVLKENDAHATFFEIGNQVAENADVVKRIAAEGNQIGSHTWDHASGSGQGVNLTFMTADEQRDEVTKGFSAIEDVLGTSVPHVLRAPGGNYYGSLVENLKDLVDVEVGWNVDTEDWRRPGADKIAEAIMSAQPGNVVLMHDGGGDRSQTVEALKIALPKLKAESYSFVTIDELMSTYGSSGSGSN